MKLSNSMIYFVVQDENNNQLIGEFKKIGVDISVFYYDQPVFKTSVDNYKKIKKAYPYLKIKKIKYEGYLYWQYLVKKYYLAIILLFINTFIVFLLSFLIVDIDIQTSDKSLYKVVNEALLNEDIHPFSIRKSYGDIQKIKDNIKEKNESIIDWLEIKKIGMKYVVNVEKKVINNISTPARYCNIYAKKSGMVKRVKTYQGTALVSMNDYVFQDDLLISGDITNNEQVVSQICANGVVYADVWYIINVKIPLDYYEYEKTGKMRKNIVIKKGDEEYKIFKNRLQTFDSNDSLIGELLGIEFYLRNDEEIIKKLRHHTYEEAINKGLNEAIQKVQYKLEKDEKIVKQKVLQKQVIDSTMNIDIFIVTEEKIGYQSVKEQ